MTGERKSKPRKQRNIDWNDPNQVRAYRKLHRQENLEERRKYDREYMRKRKAGDLTQRIGVGRADRGWTPIPMEIRRALIARANGQCERKDDTCSGVLGTHHINEDHNDHRLENLKLLCKKHHNIDYHGLGKNSPNWRNRLCARKGKGELRC